MTESENAMRNRRKGSYHLVSSRNKLPTDPEEEEEDQLFRFLTSTSNKMLRQTENFLLIQGNKALWRRYDDPSFPGRLGHAYQSLRSNTF
jgi:hypothetical protein